jgi:transposase
MRKSPKFSPEVQERAVRMVFDAKDQYPSQWAAIESISSKIGCTAETLRKWVRQGERDSGARPGPTTPKKKPTPRPAQCQTHRADRQRLSQP